MHFPVEDVIKNVRYFLSVVKRATGNQRDPDADPKESSKRPGESCSGYGGISALKEHCSYRHHKGDSEFDARPRYSHRRSIDIIHS